MVDRPEGKAGGAGLGFNGGQLLALSIGGCLCNDIRYASHAMGVSVDEIEVDVSLSLEGDPLLATAAEVDIRDASTASNEDIASLLDRAK